MARSSEITDHRSCIGRGDPGGLLHALVGPFLTFRTSVVDVENRFVVEVNEEKSTTVELAQGASFGYVGFEFRRIRSRSGGWAAIHTQAEKADRVIAKAQRRLSALQIPAGELEDPHRFNLTRLQEAFDEALGSPRRLSRAKRRHHLGNSASMLVDDEHWHPELTTYNGSCIHVVSPSCLAQRIHVHMAIRAAGEGVCASCIEY
ncbi:MAG: hypothetical protein JF606_17700 [Burkholderiales bacterium]|nr:hypothetical protein [Burkholderiales bacterium]